MSLIRVPVSVYIRILSFMRGRLTLPHASEFTLSGWATGWRPHTYYEATNYYEATKSLSSRH